MKKKRALSLKERQNSLKEKRRREIAERKEHERLIALEKKRNREERKTRYTKYISMDLNQHSMNQTDIPYKERKKFYESDEWKQVRDKFKEGKELKCASCGRKPDPNYKKEKIDLNRSPEEKERLRIEWEQNRIVIDHKLPVRFFWHLRLKPANFQLLCGCCNEEKLNWIRSEHFQKMLQKCSSKNRKHEILEVYRQPINNMV